MTANKGCTAAKAASAPPTIKVSVPATAPPIPPDTGASSVNNPAAHACSATARALSTSTVEQSHSTAPCCIAGITSTATLRRMAPFGSMVMTTSAPAAACAAVSARATPSGMGAVRSNPRTAWPALARFAAIGPPMLPKPIKPIFMLLSLTLQPAANNEGNGTRPATSAPLSTAANSAGCHFGRRSLSITAARTPS